MGAVADRILAAARPEDLFGDVDTGGEVTFLFREMAREVHPDRVAVGAEYECAAQAFARLVVLRDRALELLEEGRYGSSRTVLATIRTRRHEYRVSELLGRGSAALRYLVEYEDDGATRDALVKVAPRDGKFLRREGETLRRLLGDADRFDALSPFLPRLVEDFDYRSKGRRYRAIAYRREPGWWTLEDVRAAHPGGLDPRDAAWMFRRLLFVLGQAHEAGVVHGAVVAHHVLIHPADHGLTLVDWTGRPYRVGPGAAPEVREGKPATSASDVWSAAAVLRTLCEGRLSPPLRRFVGGTCLNAPARRPGALELLSEFDDLIVRLWGPRRYRPFSMEAA